MSETVTKKKQKKKIDYKAIELEVKPLVGELDKHESSAKELRFKIAKILHPIYITPGCSIRMLIGATGKSSTWFYNLLNEFDLDKRYPKITEAFKQRNPINLVDGIEYKKDQINISEEDYDPDEEDWLDYVDPNYVEKEDSGWHVYEKLHDKIRAPRRVTFYDISKCPNYKEKLIQEVRETIKWLEDQLVWIEKEEAKNERERANTGKR